MRDPEKGRFEATMSKAMVAEAREIALRLLKDHVVPALDKSIVQRGNEIIRKREKELAKRT
jgi:trimethylamine:corrinoid methyltransferase-like protein